MAAPDLTFIKTWCRIDGTEFDAMLPAMIAHATALASHETGVDYLAADMPESVQMWCGAQVAYWLSTPEAAVAPIGNNPSPNIFLDGLLDPYRLFNLEAAPVI